MKLGQRRRLRSIQRECPKINFGIYFLGFIEILSFFCRLNRYMGIEPSSSEEGCDDPFTAESYRRLKKMRKRRKMRSALAKSQLQDIEAQSNGDSDEALESSDSEGLALEEALEASMHGNPPFEPLNTNRIQRIKRLDLHNEMLSGGENDGSYSSPLSQKSGKNMADFDDDDSPCEEELAQLAATSHCLTAFTAPRNLNLGEHFVAGAGGSNATANTSSTLSSAVAPKTNRNPSTGKMNANAEPTACKLSPAQMTVNEISQPANILLWDLLMDDKIVSVRYWSRFRESLFDKKKKRSFPGPSRRIVGQRNGEGVACAAVFQHREKYSYEIHRELFTEFGCESQCDRQFASAAESVGLVSAIPCNRHASGDHMGRAAAQNDAPLFQ